jgi:hypothetical protein
MARSRNIKPGFFLNDELAECEPLARLLFAGLWCIADREGRLEDRPKRIKIEVLPYDNCDVDELLNQLAKQGFILRYEVGGNRYIQIVNFLKHQNPHKNEVKSVIPPPLENNREMYRSAPEISGEEQEKHSTNPADSLNMIPDSFNNISTSEQGPDTTPDQKGPEKPKKPRQIPLFDKTTEQYKLALFMRDCVLANLPKAKVPEPTPEGLRRWAYDIDLMVRIDHRSPDEIRQLIDWAHRDPFWKANILSPGKLREKWDTLVAHKQRGEERIRGAPKYHAPQAANFEQRKYTKEDFEKLYKDV